MDLPVRGLGDEELEWKRIVSALRLAGYDGVLSIADQDALVSTHEGMSAAVEMLSRLLLKGTAREGSVGLAG